MTLDHLHSIRYNAALDADDFDAIERGLIDGFSMTRSMKADTLTLDDIGLIMAKLELTGGKDIDECEARAIERALSELLWHRRADEQAEAMATAEEMSKLSSASPPLILVDCGHA